MKKGWKLEKLGDVCEIIMGQSPNGKSYNSIGKGVPLINGPVEFSNGSFGETIRSKFTTQPTKLCKEGDLILCVRGSTTGRMNIAGFDACIGRGVAAIRAKQFQPWINHFVSSKRDEIHGKGTGATFPNVSGTMLANFELLMPPLPEQQRIVAILDEAFEAIAAACANAEQNRQNARALFGSYLQSVFSQRGDGWTEKPLGEMATFRNGVNFTKSSKGEPIKILGVKDFQNYYWAPLNGLDSIIPDSQLPDTDTLQQNDIVFVRSNGNPELIGRCLLIGEVQERTTFSGFTIRARQFTEEVLPQYLCHFLKSSHIRRELIDGGNGASIRSLNQGALSRLRINFPVALSEQEHIVEQLETMQSETQHLESLYLRKIAALDELKQSLLQQAFSGQL